MISVKGLRKVYEGHRQQVTVLKGVDFEVEPGTIFTLLGPSGCGKTTTLRCVAGLEQPDSGKIGIGGETAYCSSSRINIPTERRHLGMVFQSYAIWPHMTVGENVIYPLQAQGGNAARMNERVHWALDLVGLGDLKDRPAPNLSGGQQQRVALARALVAEPTVLLLDEPLSNLDAKLRDQMRHEILALQRRLGLTTLFVTHDQEEALSLSNVIALMNGGEVVEMGAPKALYDFPQNRFTAAFLGLANFLSAREAGRSAGRVAVDTAFGRFEAAVRSGSNEFFFRPHKARLVPKDMAGALNIGTGRVESVVFLGEIADVIVAGGEEKVRLRLPSSSDVTVGDDVSYEVDPQFSLCF